MEISNARRNLKRTISKNEGFNLQKNDLHHNFLKHKWQCVLDIIVSLIFARAACLPVWVSLSTQISSQSIKPHTRNWHFKNKCNKLFSLLLLCLKHEINEKKTLQNFTWNHSKPCSLVFQYFQPTVKLMAFHNIFVPLLKPWCNVSLKLFWKNWNEFLTAR